MGRQPASRFHKGHGERRQSRPLSRTRGIPAVPAGRPQGRVHPRPRGWQRDLHTGLVKARADGSRPRQLTVSPVSAPDQDGNRQLLFIDSRPRFSPDGRRIVFLRSDAGQAGGVGDIYLMDANGNHVEQLTPHRRYANNYADPTFSPDGRMIAFADESSNGRSIMPQIYVMHPDGRGRRPATRSRGWFTGLDWQSLPPIDQGPWGTRR
ncbi:MAG: hypothetical protein E6J32_12965 [Chloroflexi bacterium]|nr:MAG: hypothetical protein E6J32_12965 [Chloroflexota bacterium]